MFFFLLYEEVIYAMCFLTAALVKGGRTDSVVLSLTCLHTV